jgi:hypothetical protein
LMKTSTLFKAKSLLSPITYSLEIDVMLII